MVPLTTLLLPIMLATVLVFIVSQLPDSIWRGQSWRTTAKNVFDGMVYALVTAGTFGWLWPA
jgi:hypothetical protein